MVRSVKLRRMGGSVGATLPKEMAERLHLNAKYTSNKTHYSPTDPDARISVKPGKARKLNYQSQLAVDTAHHVITHIGADFADLKDNQCLQGVVKKLKPRLQRHGLIWQNVLADTAYSSGENYAFLERETSTPTYLLMAHTKEGRKGLPITKKEITGSVARASKLSLER